MTTLTLYNTRTRRKEEFTPIDAQNVRMYVCGPTVYDRAHLGNARPVIVFDVLYRLLRHVYGAEHVTYVRNFTDVDDKINARAAESGRSIGDITAETTQWFLDDMAEVGALEPDAMPRATQYIAQMVAMIEDLIAKGHAYAAEGHVLFAVESYEAYGKLSGRSVDDMIAGARVEVAPYKRNPMDFVLWKPSDDDAPGWGGPVVEGKSIGRGRPGWHIECSAMAHDLLGGAFDIHGGGNDLMFPHHENEIAQSKCAGHDFANVWMHNEMLQVEGKKMSKSLGNFFTVRDLLDQGVPGEVIRFVMLSTHYRKPMDWTERKRTEAEKTLEKWAALLQNYESGSVNQEFLANLSDDLNTPAAMTTLHKYARAENLAGLRGGLTFLGFGHLQEFEQIKGFVALEDDRIDELIVKRAAARAARQWAKSDAIRGYLQIAGIVIEDGTHAVWRQDVSQDVLGWLAVAAPAFDGKLRLSIEKLESLAKESGFKVEKDQIGKWTSVSKNGGEVKNRHQFIQLAIEEANA